MEHFDLLVIGGGPGGYLCAERAAQGGMTVTMNEDGTLSAQQQESDHGLTPAEGLSYARFRELMNQADDLLGGGSDYREDRLSAFAYRGKTYEEALREYEEAREIDRYTGAHARLFSDYMTIFCAFLPAFLMVSEGLRDRRARMRELIFTRRVLLPEAYPDPVRRRGAALHGPGAPANGDRYRSQRPAVQRAFH